MIGIGNDFFVDLVNVKRYVYRAIFCLKSKTKVVHSCLSLHTSYIGPQKRLSAFLSLPTPLFPPHHLLPVLSLATALVAPKPRLCFCSPHLYLCLQPWFPSPLVPTPPSLLLVCSSNLYPPTCRLLMFYVSPPQWSRITKNPDVSTEPLACPFARSLAPLTRTAHMFARALRGAHLFACSLTLSLPRS